MARKTIFVKHVEQDSTQTAPTHHSAKRVILESIKKKKGKQRVFLVCRVSMDEQMQRTAATATSVKLEQHQLNLVARSRVNHPVKASSFSVVEQHQ